MLKKVMVVLLFGIVFLMGMSTAGFAEVVKLSVNDELFVPPDVPPQTIDGRTVVPLRFISAVLGAQVGWDNNSQTAIIRKDFTSNVSINKAINPVNDGKLKLEINGETIYSSEDAPLLMIQGRVVVPLRFLAKQLGAYITWDKSTSTVILIPEVQRKAIALLRSAAVNLENAQTPVIKGKLKVSVYNPGEIDLYQEEFIGMNDRVNKQLYLSISALSENQEYFLTATKNYSKKTGEPWKEVSITDEGRNNLFKLFNFNHIINYVENEGFHYFLEYYPVDAEYRIYISTDDKEKVYNILESKKRINISKDEFLKGVTETKIYYMLDIDKETLFISDIDALMSIAQDGVTTYLHEDLYFFYNENIEKPSLEIVNSI